MPDTTTSGAKSADASSRKTPLPFPRWWSSPRTITFLTLALATIAVAVAVAAWFRAGHAGPSFTDDQTAQAKTKVCSAYKTVRAGVVINTNLNPAPDDAVGQLSVLVNSRLALLGGGAYLRDRVAAEPAAPADLTQAANSMADTIEQLGAAYLANENSTVVEPLRHDRDSQMSQLNKLCS